MKFTSILLTVIVLGASTTMGAMITLTQNTATATFEQAGFTAAQAVDGITTANNGWAIDPNEFAAQTAVWETASDVGGTGGASFTFTIIQNQGGSHTLGHFRLSVTTDSRNDFANGDGAGGDVSANWTTLAPSTASDAGTGTETFTINLDDSIRVTDDSPSTATYVVTATTTITGITGIRLEALKYTDPTEGNGPGRVSNGNFVLSEFQVDAVNLVAVPEPASLAVLFLGALPMLLRRQRTGC